MISDGSFESSVLSFESSVLSLQSSEISVRDDSEPSLKLRASTKTVHAGSGTGWACVSLGPAVRKPVSRRFPLSVFRFQIGTKRG